MVQITRNFSLSFRTNFLVSRNLKHASIKILKLSANPLKGFDAGSEINATHCTHGTFGGH